MSAYPNVVEALVGTDPKLQHLYLKNAWFHNSIEQLAAGAVVVVDGLAAVAEKQSAKMREEVERIRKLPPLATALFPGAAPRKCVDM